ncbi:MAG: hypothetical protein A4E62_01761 [Syntrophorhabdus sp. PtaU1.Bin002]|nr:MAG: hypothetical protein A4E62_01761 [Syntrophorhabdus sp. PtaU1.Bin002]
MAMVFSGAAVCRRVKQEAFMQQRLPRYPVTCYREIIDGGHHMAG